MSSIKTRIYCGQCRTFTGNKGNPRIQGNKLLGSCIQCNKAKSQNLHGSRKQNTQKYSQQVQRFSGQNLPPTGSKYKAKSQMRAPVKSNYARAEFEAFQQYKQQMSQPLAGKKPKGAPRKPKQQQQQQQPQRETEDHHEEQDQDYDSQQQQQQQGGFGGY